MNREEMDGLLRDAPELAGLCTQNGWIDSETLRFEVVEAGDPGVLLRVWFEEIVMEGAGCVADRKPCFGRVRVMPGTEGRPPRVTVL